MSNNETLTVPAPIPDAYDIQTASTALPEERNYVYQRADGTVERARDVEDAIAQCPVLGKLAIEAPDQASMLLDLAAMGNAKMAAEVTKRGEKPDAQEKYYEPRLVQAVESEKKLPDSSLKKNTTPELHLVISGPAEPRRPVFSASNGDGYSGGDERLKLQWQQENFRAFDRTSAQDMGVAAGKIESSQKSSTAIVPLNKIKTEPVNQFKINGKESDVLDPVIIMQEEKRHQQKAEIQAIDSEPALTETAEELYVEIAVAEETTPKTHGNVEIIILPDEHAAALDKPIETSRTDYQATDTETNSGLDELEVPVFTSNMTDNSSTEQLILEVEVEIDKKLELLFEPETIKTYSELKDLIGDPKVISTTLAPTTEPGSSIMIEPKSASEPEAAESLTFEALAAPQTAAGEILSLEFIKEQSSRQPLELTFVQLANHMTYFPENDKQLEPLLAIIDGIERSFPSYSSEQEMDVHKLQITPEAADKLLALLRELGYQHPREALLRMVEKFGYAYLLQSLSYLFRLANEDYRRELRKASAPKASSDDGTLSTLSRLILKLVMKQELQQEIIAS